MKLYRQESEDLTARPPKADSKDMVSHMKCLWADRRPGILDRKPGMDFAVLVPLIEKDGEFHILFEVRSPKLKSQQRDVSINKNSAITPPPLNQERQPEPATPAASCPHRGNARRRGF